MSQDAQAYRAQTPYIHAYFRQQHARQMRFVLLLAGYRQPDDISDLPHLELGFGQGLGLALTAAASGEQQVGVDFNPEQVAALERLLHDSQVDCELHAADFARFDQQDQRQYQSISLHGVWSWVAPSVRDALVQLFARKLAPGGLLYLSHNTLPGRAPLLPLQRLLALQADRQDPALPVEDRVQQAFSQLGEVMALSAYVQSQPTLLSWWQGLSEEHPVYLEHEYLGNAWHPMLFADTARALADAGLKWVCSADALEQLVDLHLDEQQQHWLRAFADQPDLYQSHADLLRNTAFRRDLFARGLQPITSEQQWQALMETSLILLHPAGSLPLELQGDRGVFELPQAPFHALLELLADVQFQPKPVHWLYQQLQQRLSVTPNGFMDMLRSLLALGYLHPAHSDEQARKQQAICQRLNSRLCQRAWHSGAITYLASPVAGCGVRVSRLQQLLLLARAQLGEGSDPAHWALWLLQQQQRLGVGLWSEDQGPWLSEQAQAFAHQRLPLLIALGATL